MSAKTVWRPKRVIASLALYDTAKSAIYNNHYDKELCNGSVYQYDTRAINISVQMESILKHVHE